ncbi:MAG: ketoacyl-ACP synthase III [Bacteroidales bacterium]|nr:ketoacyl-ACP synthase III [Bacteroidales bacterium]
MNIKGTGSSHPKLTVTNHMLMNFMDTSNEWIVERTGITQRRVLSSEKLEDLATDASLKAIKDARTTAEKIDYIICSNVMNDYCTPSLSSIVQSKIGSRCPCLDINAACSGFVYALQVADSFIKTGVASNILIVCAEETTRMLNWHDRSTSILFGDGAGAAVVSSDGNCCTIRTTCSDKGDVLYYRRRLEETPFISREDDACPLHMDGQAVFKAAVTSCIKDMNALLDECNLKHEDITYYVLHQANLRIIETIAHFFGQDMAKFPHNVEKYGNISSACIPSLLDELSHEGKLKKGDRLMLSSFGAGFTTGACILEWNKE